MQTLKAAARQRLAGGQGEFDLGLDTMAGAATSAVAGGMAGGGPLPIVSSRMGRLWDGLCAAYDALGLADAAEDDEVFRHLVLAPAS